LEVRSRGLEGSDRPGLPTAAAVTLERESTAELVAVKLTAQTLTAEIHSITSTFSITNNHNISLIKTLAVSKTKQ